MPLQPATIDNGCMHFVPGSHLMEVQDHQLIEPTTEGLELTDDSGVRDAVACPLPAGGATVHANRTLHYAGANRTEEPRRALIMAFRVRPTPLEADREFPWQPDRWYEDGA
jgi:ectoine hydroxylase-related dioxygenase (phytanoyl-CoA dioxygenase family)